MATHGLATINIILAVVQILIALPFLRKYHAKSSSPFGFHPFRSLGTPEMRHGVYRFGATWLILTSAPQIPVNAYCLFLPQTPLLGVFLLFHPMVLFLLALLLTFIYVLRVRARSRHAAQERAYEGVHADTSANA